jgi:hypothetical protein
MGAGRRHAVRRPPHTLTAPSDRSGRSKEEDHLNSDRSGDGGETRAGPGLNARPLIGWIAMVARHRLVIPVLPSVTPRLTPRAHPEVAAPEEDTAASARAATFLYLCRYTDLGTQATALHATRLDQISRASFLPHLSSHSAHWHTLLPTVLEDLP